MIKYLFTTLALLVLSQVSMSQKIHDDEELNKLLPIMEGNYSSEQQSITDTNYYKISLAMTQIWRDRTDGKWLYVEQAIASRQDKPYRKRVCHLQHPSKNIFTSDIYTLKQPSLFIVMQQDTTKRKQLTFDLI